MPSIPEVEERDDTVRDQIVAATRRATGVVVPREVGLRSWVALIVVLVVATTNPVIPLAVAGCIASVFIAVDLAARRRA